MANKTAIQRVRTALVEKGQALSSKEISSRFGVANPRDVIYRLRNSGVNVTLKTFKGKRGRSAQKYTVA